MSLEDRRLGELLALPAPAGERQDYGAHEDAFVETFGEATPGRTTVVLIHGGYFRASTGLAHARPFAHALAGRGAHVVLPEYRRGPGRHAEARGDVAAAVSWAIDAGRGGPLVVAGHSAGGCLALSWASEQPSEGPRVAVRALAPITDLVREAHERLAGGAVRDFMGAAPQQDPARYLAADPRSRIALVPRRLDVRLVHGTRDETVDVEFSRTFPAPLLELPGAHHFDVIDPESPHAEAVMTALLGPGA